MNVACANKILHFSNWKRLFQNTWLEDAQIEAEHHQMTKQVPKSSDVNIARKKEFIKKNYGKCTKCGIFMFDLREKMT